MDTLDSSPSPWATEVHRGPGFILGKFDCPPDAPAWREENWVGNHPHVVFPRIPVLIGLRGHELVSDPNMVVLYRAGETYTRRLIDPRGDRCFYAEVAEELLEEMLGATSRGRPIFPETTVPLDARIYALQWRTVRYYETERDGLALDEGVLAVLGAVLARVGNHTISDRSGHRRLVERAKRVLNEAMHEQLTLREIAGLVHVSPYHLTRLFHRYTGMPLHRYRNQLRLRASLGKLEEGAEPLRKIACETGFSSHSHFTARFREAFGFTPVEWRQGSLHPCRLFFDLAGARTTNE